MEQPKHFLEGKKIIVAGSGIAGLAFIVAFCQQWDPTIAMPEIKVYDRDPKELSKSREGYSLAINGMDQNGGLVALRELGLLEEVLRYSLTGSDIARSFRMWDANWSTLIRGFSKPYDGLPTTSLRITRKRLRNILVHAVQSSVDITWRTSCTSAERLEDDRIRVHLEGPNGVTTDECDLLIAADGAHSKIRASFRPDDKLTYAGAVQIGGIATFPDGNLPEPIDKSWGIAVSGQNAACFMSPLDEHSIIWALSREEANPPPQAAQNDKETILEHARQLGSVFKGPFPAVLAATDLNTMFAIAAQDKQPFAHSKSLLGVVFIGDSNHAVSPFAGNGANLAMKDGWGLATQLCHCSTLEEAVVAYDSLAVARASKTLSSSRWRISIAHATGIKHFVFRFAFGVGRTLMWLTGM